jgi:CRP/FNR family transcriptional regulator, cyclic AMP receptor protein
MRFPVWRVIGAYVKIIRITGGPMAYKDLLKNIYLFKDFNHEELDPIQEVCVLENANNGDAIFYQGDAAKALYIIKFGSVKISQKGTEGDGVDITVLGTGSHFGEMPLLDNEARSATATASEKTELIKIDYAGLKGYLASKPAVAAKFYKSLAGFLCGRLRITTTDLGFSREKNLHHF